MRPISIYYLYAQGKTRITPDLFAKGYGQSTGQLCERCHKPLKRFPVFSGKLCWHCYTPRKENREP